MLRYVYKEQSFDSLSSSTMFLHIHVWKKKSSVVLVQVCHTGRAIRDTWLLWGSNPRPSECKADVLGRHAHYETMYSYCGNL